MAALCFFFPVAGWMLWAIKKNTEPAEAKICLKWAWIGFACSIVAGLLTWIIISSSTGARPSATTAPPSAWAIDMAAEAADEYVWPTSRAW